MSRTLKFMFTALCALSLGACATTPDATATALTDAASPVAELAVDAEAVDAGADALADDAGEEAGTEEAKSEEAGGCSCPTGKEGGTVWCDHCKVGYIEGKKANCKGCVDAATAGTKCEGCSGKGHKDADG